jgi:hypothetical protein
MYLKNSVTISSIAVVSLFLLPISTNASTIQSTAYVNLNTPVDYKKSSDINSVVSSYADAGNASAFASATGTTLKAYAKSNGIGLSFISDGNSAFHDDYTIRGNKNNISIPLSFNFSLSGNIDLQTGTGPTGGFSVASGLANFRLFNDSPGSLTKELIQITSQAGQIVYFNQTGNLGDSSLYATITPNILFGTNLLEKIPDSILEKVGFNTGDLKISAAGIKANGIQNKTDLFTVRILALIASVGIPELSIAKGAKIGIGYDINYIFKSNFSLLQTINSSNGSHFIDGFLDTIASSSTSPPAPPASATVDYSHTFELDSITVPQSFDLSSLPNLQVVFDSGQTINVTQASDPTAVPEPFTIMGTFVGGTAALRMRKKLKATSDLKAR